MFFCYLGKNQLNHKFWVFGFLVTSNLVTQQNLAKPEHFLYNILMCQSKLAQVNQDMSSLHNNLCFTTMLRQILRIQNSGEIKWKCHRTVHVHISQKNFKL